MSREIIRHKGENKRGRKGERRRKKERLIIIEGREYHENNQQVIRVLI